MVEKNEQAIKKEKAARSNSMLDIFKKSNGNFFSTDTSEADEKLYARVSHSYSEDYVSNVPVRLTDDSLTATEKGSKIR